MALTLIELDYITPPSGVLFGVPIGTAAQALDIWEWAATTPGYTCTLTAAVSGEQTIQIEGIQAETLRAPIGGDAWIVYNNGTFEYFETSTAALQKYKVKG